MLNLLRCTRCRALEQEYDAAMAELRKYLTMNPEESLVGGIRNLAQCYLSYREAADSR